MKVLFWISLFIIFYSMVGYPLTLFVLDWLFKKTPQTSFGYEPEVTIMVVAHNEEKIILEKLKNLSEINYPKTKLEILIASDNCTDRTDDIVREYIKENPDLNIRLNRSLRRLGKTNAQNEAQKHAKGEILVMTDANSMLEENAINELLTYFSGDEVSYVCGRLLYINAGSSASANSESTYWNLDLKMREIESNFQTITAGNGALYAIRNNRYHDFNPIESHDSSMPLFYALKNEKALYNPKAIATEKAGETIDDEFSRKVRMNRIILKGLFPSISIFNIIKMKWFTLFYFGHRTCRYSLWLMHIVLFISNIFLANLVFYRAIFVFQTIFYLIAIFVHWFKIENRVGNIIYYYVLTIYAQFLGVLNSVLGKNKPFWEKAESTR